MIKRLIFCILLPFFAMAGNLATETFVTNRVAEVRTNLQTQIDGRATTQSVAQASAAAAYAYSPTNTPPYGSLTINGQLWNAATNGSITIESSGGGDQSSTLTNVLLSADLGTNGWWTLFVITNGVRSLMQ